MNIQEMNIMNTLKKQPYTNQRILAEVSGLSLGKVNQLLNCLKQQGYLTCDMKLTPLAQKLFHKSSPQNAIILAAGLGMRMLPVNMEIPKGTLQIHGEILIERLIKQLHESGVRKIYVVVGFMKEEFEYLIDNYQVELIVNSEYASKNNLHSLSLLADQIHNSYIIPCDMWCAVNPFQKYELYSWYMVTEQADAESSVRMNRKGELVRTADGGNYMIGIAYISASDAPHIRQRLMSYALDPRYNYSFWEEILFDGNKMILSARMFQSKAIQEINTYEQLRELDSDSKHLQNDAINKIAGTFGVSPSEVHSITALKKGMTNRSFLFTCRNRQYIMRIPGEGTDLLINRRQEYNVYQLLDGKNICDKVHFFSPENGYKITEFIPSAHTCNPDNPKEVQKCMRFLREIHHRNMQVDHTFDIFLQLEFYEELRRGEIGAPSCYKDYEQTKEKIYELKKYIDAQPKEWGLAHIDSVPDNFLLFSAENGTEEIRLIDWEYAGMQDVHVDIAMFAIYSLYDRPRIEALIDAYFSEGCSLAVRLKIYCYISVCGLLWSNWCEFKRMKGIEFGEYSLRQYRYAKDYYLLFKSYQEGNE